MIILIIVFIPSCFPCILQFLTEQWTSCLENVRPRETLFLPGKGRPAAALRPLLGPSVGPVRTSAGFGFCCGFGRLTSPWASGPSGGGWLPLELGEGPAVSQVPVSGQTSPLTLSSPLCPWPRGTLPALSTLPTPGETAVTCHLVTDVRVRRSPSLVQPPSQARGPRGLSRRP